MNEHDDAKGTEHPSKSLDTYVSSHVPLWMVAEYLVLIFPIFSSSFSHTYPAFNLILPHPVYNEIQRLLSIPYSTFLPSSLFFSFFFPFISNTLFFPFTFALHPSNLKPAAAAALSVSFELLICPVSQSPRISHKSQGSRVNASAWESKVPTNCMRISRWLRYSKVLDQPTTWNK